MPADQPTPGAGLPAHIHFTVCEAIPPGVYIHKPARACLFPEHWTSDDLRSIAADLDRRANRGQEEAKTQFDTSSLQKEVAEKEANRRSVDPTMLLRSAIESARGLCESEAGRWRSRGGSGDKKTADHWDEVAAALRASAQPAADDTASAESDRFLAAHWAKQEHTKLVRTTTQPAAASDNASLLDRLEAAERELGEARAVIAGISTRPPGTTGVDMGRSGCDCWTCEDMIEEAKKFLSHHPRKEASDMTSWTSAAEMLATLCHQGQYRRDGRTAYIIHPMMVAHAVPDRLKPIAWLHDAIEDCPYTIEAMRPLLDLLPRYIADAVMALTKRPEDDYFDDYLPRVKANPDALAVKLADIANNLSDQPTPEQSEKYAKALAYLTGASHD